MKQVKKKKDQTQKEKAVCRLRMVACILGSIMLIMSMSYSTRVTRNIQAQSSSLDVDSYYSSYTTQVASTFTSFTSFLGGGSASAEGTSDLHLYPEAFRERKTEEHDRRKKKGGGNPESDPASWTDEQRTEMRHKFRVHNRNSIYSLLLLPRNEIKECPTWAETPECPPVDTNMQWGRLFEYFFDHFRKRSIEGLYEFHDLIGYHLEDEPEEKKIAWRDAPGRKEKAWGNTPDNAIPKPPRVIHEYNLCHAFLNAEKIAKFNTPHILISHMNENWGTLSSEVPGRTGMWGDILRNDLNIDKGCEPSRVRDLYLESPNTLAVFTTQHQALFDHPKVISIPIGVGNSRNAGERLLNKLTEQQAKMLEGSNVDPKTKQRIFPNTGSDPRPKLLMMNASPSDTRRPQMDAISRNFEKAGIKLSNTYNDEGNYMTNVDAYLRQLNRAKFIFCPSGLGWDTYRAWESIAMGVIPVIERYHYRYEVLAFPPGSDRADIFLRTIERGEKKRKRLTPDMRKKLRRFNATIEVVEYEDGWRRAFDDLPVVWIDGFESESPEPGKNFLTPEFLEEQYDAMAARMEDFRYEKLTSIYWIRLIESFVLLEEPTRAQQWDVTAPITFGSPAEKRNWEAAMGTLSEMFNDRELLELLVAPGEEVGEEALSKWKGGKYSAGMFGNLVGSSSSNSNSVPGSTPVGSLDLSETGSPGDSETTSSPYLFGNKQPIVLSWVMLIQAKLLGLYLVITGWNKLAGDFKLMRSSGRNSKQDDGAIDGSSKV